MHSYNKIWLHSIFSTKYRQSLITLDVEQAIYRYVQLQLVELSCPVRIINGMPDHVHLLYLQNPRLAVADILKQVKGSSSHWINGQELIKEKFAWQTGYATFSVSDMLVERVFQYIANQKRHHTHQSFAEELRELGLQHGLVVEPEL